MAIQTAPPPAPPSAAGDPGPVVRAFLADRGLDPAGLCLEIDPADEMLGFLRDAAPRDRERALFSYFQSGWSIARGLLQVLAWRFGSLDRVGRVLDFASGYGRVSRFLAGPLPADRLWVSDIYPGAVRFQRERLGVHGAVSSVLPRDLELEGPFDAILVTSLFTHLPEERFAAWLARLWEMLAPGGILVFSVHGPGVLPQGEALPDSGLLFQAVSESGSLAPEDYGSTWVSEEFVRRALRQVAGEAASLHLLPRALNNFQDLCLAVPEAGADFAGLSFVAEPQLYLETCALVGRDRLKLSGWTVLRGGEAKWVEALLDGELVARFQVCDRRPRVAEMMGGDTYLISGWGDECLLPERADFSSVLLLRVEDGRGGLHPVYGATLAAALLESSRLAGQVLEGQLTHEREQAALAAARAAAAQAGLEARLAAMEASRFWKIRNAWFRLKRLLGLTDEA